MMPALSMASSCAGLKGDGRLGFVSVPPHPLRPCEARGDKLLSSGGWDARVQSRIAMGELFFACLLQAIQA
jgi:hypothetical protein